MANQEHLDILKQGVETWNQWRKEHIDIQPDLSGADLIEANLSEADLREANLSYVSLYKADLSYAGLIEANLYKADLIEAKLWGADLSGAKLSEATLSKATLGYARLREAYLNEAMLDNASLWGTDLSFAILSGANLSGAYFNGAKLWGANLSYANLSYANLGYANLSGAILISTHFTQATLTGCRIYGISAWDVDLEGTKQNDLVITDVGQPEITVDSLEVAQFIYLLLNNKKIREVIDTITSKVVLILGRFTDERKIILDAIRDDLRKRNYSPILFDFEKPASRDITETISTLAHMARFVIADITDAKSIPQELSMIVPNLPSVPVQPLILSSQHEYGMFEHFMRFPWVLPVYRYTDEGSLLKSLKESIIDPAEQKAQDLERP